MDLEDIQKHLDQEMNKQNNRSVPEFEGYSPIEMQNILHFTFEKESPLELQKLSDLEYKQIPILNQIKYLGDLIDICGELKLTNKGYLPTKIVSDLYSKGFMKDESIEKGFTKLYKETDSISVNLTRILIEISGLAKKRKGKLSLTKSSKKIFDDNEKLLRHVFLTFANKFNWAYYDGYGENQVGQLGYGFTLILLSKYGQTKRLDSFYSEKYFKAYPRLLETIEPSYGTLESYAGNCYSIRTFERFLNYFGLINIEVEAKALESFTYITKTALFDRLIKVRPDNSLDR